MEQYLVAINDGKVFYRLVDDAEALDNLFGIYGTRIIGCWKMKPPEFNERLGEGRPEGVYPDCEIIPLREGINVDGI